MCMNIWNLLKQNKDDQSFIESITLSFASVQKDFEEFTNQLIGQQLNDYNKKLIKFMWYEDDEEFESNLQ